MPVDIYPESVVPIPEGFEPFSIEKVNYSVAELLQEAYERYADNIAIDVDSRKISYRELDRLTNRLANVIIAQAGDKEEPVAVLVEQGVSQIIAILAILKTGKIYSAMDLSNPSERLTTMLADFGARLIISNSNNSALARSVIEKSIPVIEMDKLGEGDKKILINRSVDKPLGVYYTSGSTGQPKGVVYTHRSLLHFLGTVINLYCLNSNDRQPLPFSCSYAWSASPMFATLLSGGTFYPIDLRSMNMQLLAAFVEERKITVLQMSTGMLRSFMGALDKNKRHFSNLKILISGGEPMQVQDVKQWQNLFLPGTILANTFAISEAVLLTFHPISHDSDISEGYVPLGIPLPQKEIMIVDEDRRPLPQGEAGEIAIRSEYLTLGYWNKPELTDAVFEKHANDPSKRIYYSNDLGRILPNGMLEHLGRKDSFAKIRGYSVDLLEIEQAIYDLHDVKHVVIVPVPARHDSAQKQLVAYLAVSAQVARDAARFRKALGEKLPAYMIPSFFVFLDEMPLNLNGKVDKKALPPVDFTRELGVADLPADGIEKRLALIWKDVLKQKDIGVNDNFFDLGGDSLLAMQLLMMIEKEFSQRMPLAIISKASNIKEQAELLRNGNIADYASVLIPIRTTGNKKPVFCIGGKGGNPIRFHRLVHYLGTDQPVYFFRSRGFEAGEKINTTIEDIASDYLREVEKIQPEGPYYFLGESGGGLVAYEMAQQLNVKGKKTALIAMLDTYLVEMEAPAGPPAMNLTKLLQKHLQTMASGGLMNLIAYYVNLWQYKYSEWREIRKKREVFSRLGALPDVYDRVEQANVKAMRAYRPKPYEGIVMMFAAGRQSHLHGGFHPDHGWGKAGVKNLSVHVIDCYHGNILFQPFVQPVAHKLNQYLNNPVNVSS